MADEHKTETQTEETKDGQVVFNSQADFDAVVKSRLAREAAKYADYDETKAQLEKLANEKKEREEMELSELEKANKTIEELNNAISELSPYKEKEILRIKSVEEKVAKIVSESDLTDSDKELVNNISDPDGKLALINRLTENKQQPPSGGYNGGASGQKRTTQEMNELRVKDPVKFKEEYPKWRMQN